jgi:hypothetical protein
MRSSPIRLVSCPRATGQAVANMQTESERARSGWGRNRRRGGRCGTSHLCTRTGRSRICKLRRMRWVPS